MKKKHTVRGLPNYCEIFARSFVQSLNFENQGKDIEYDWNTKNTYLF